METNKQTTTAPALDERAGSLDVGDIVLMVAEERKLQRKLEYRKKEIEDQISELRKELDEIEERWVYAPRWHDEIFKRVADAADNLENTEVSHEEQRDELG